MGFSRSARQPHGLSRRTFLAGAGIAAAGLAACRSGSDGRDSDDGNGDSRPVKSYDYGDHPSQVADLYLPTDGKRPWPVVVLLHGGFWRSGYDRSLMHPLALDLISDGYAAWNVGYRSTGDDGGGWPATFEDVAAAIDRLAGAAEDHPLDLGRVITVGHSAGATLGLWAAARPHFDAGVPGHDPAVPVCGAVVLAGVTNLVSGWFEDLGSGAVDELMGFGPNEDRATYRLASPEDLVPIGVSQLLVHGRDDPIVPPDQSIAYEGKAAEAGDDVELLMVDAVDHFGVIDPKGVAWAKVKRRLGKLCE